MATTKPVTHTTHPTRRRWWLWWPLLALSAWLALRDGNSNSPGEAQSVSLPARSTNRLSSIEKPVPGLQPGAAPLVLIPREQLLAETSVPPHATESAPRDLFASRSWTRQPESVAPVAPVTPSAPPLPFRYVGKQWNGEAWEVYAVHGEQTYVLREGQVLDDIYKVGQIAPPNAWLTYLPLGTTQTLSIGDTR